MNPAQIFNFKKIQPLMDSFCKSVGIASAVIDLEGIVLVSSNWKKLCTDFHRQNPETCKNCVESDTYLAGKVRSGEKHTIYTCRNGLTSAASPIIIQENHVANLFVGQFLFKSPDIDMFRKQALLYGFNEAAYLEALSHVPVVPEDKVKWVLEYLINFAELLGDMGISAINEKKAFKRLQESEDRLRAIADYTYDWESWFSPDGHLLWLNPAVEKLSGYSMKECGKMSDYPLPIVHEDDRAKFAERLRLAVAEKTPENAIEFRISHKSGEVKWMSVSWQPIYDKNNNHIGLRSSIRDITNRKQAEKERGRLMAHLNHQQKLESIGTLANSIAHEINNPINGIMNCAQIINDKLNPENTLCEFAKGIISESERISETVRNLMAFARQDKEPRSLTNITAIVNKVVSFIDDYIKLERIDLKVHIFDDLPMICCNSLQIQQVLINLITNSRDALNQRYHGYNPDKTITITARPFDKEGMQWLRVTVEDHGIGISDEILNRIFDPFFTTQDQTMGTGMGLSISQDIALNHKGTLSVCAGNDYTQFHLDLPGCETNNTECRTHKP